MVDVEDLIEKNRKLIAVLAVALLLLYFYNSGLFNLNIVLGPEGVDCSLYSAVANGGVSVSSALGTATRLLTSNVGVPSVIGQAAPNSWIAYTDYSETSITGVKLDRRIGYQWIRPDPKTPVIQAVAVDRATGTVLKAVNLQVRISKPSMQDVNTKGDPLGRNPTEIDWYSYNTQPTQNGDTVTWKHYEAYVVPVDFIVELSVRPGQDNNVGDFQSFDLWLVLDTVEWINAFSSNQYALLNASMPSGASISSYNFRGAFPIWAWVGAWQPWQVKSYDSTTDKWYDPATLSSQEESELQGHLQVMPSYGGSEVTLYTQPGYIYTRTFAEDVIRNNETLGQTLAAQIPGLPDPRFAETVYFPVTLMNYGAMRMEGYSPFYPFGYWHKEFYPTSYLRVRALYAVYGEWIYAWTQQEAEKQNYVFENSSSVIMGEQSVWDKFLGAVGGFFTSPWTLLWTAIVAFFLILVVVAVLAIFAPEVFAALTLRRRRGEG